MRDGEGVVGVGNMMVHARDGWRDSLQQATLDALLLNIFPIRVMVYSLRICKHDMNGLHCSVIRLLLDPLLKSGF